MDLSEDHIIERAKFLIQDETRSARTHSFLARWHAENAVILADMMEAYVRLNMLGRASMEQAGMTLSKLLNVPGQKHVLREKKVRR